MLKYGAGQALMYLRRRTSQSIRRINAPWLVDPPWRQSSRPICSSSSSRSTGRNLMPWAYSNPRHLRYGQKSPSIRFGSQ